MVIVDFPGSACLPSYIARMNLHVESGAGKKLLANIAIIVKGLSMSSAESNSQLSIRPLKNSSLSEKLKRVIEHYKLDGLQFFVGLLALVACGLSVALVAYIVAANGRMAHLSVDVDNKSLARAWGQYTSAGLQLIDHTLKQGRVEWADRQGIRDHRLFYKDFPNFKALIHQVAVIDSSGHLVSSSIESDVKPVYLGDREHFKAHVDAIGDELFVSKPLVGRISQRASIQFSRRITGENGEFKGVIVASVDPGFISKFLPDESGNDGVFLGLLGLDGAIRSWVGSDIFLGGNVPASSTAFPYEGALRFPEFRMQVEPSRPEAAWYTEPLQGFPLKLVVGRDTTAMIRNLEVQAVLATCLVGFLLVFIAASAVYSVRNIRLRGRALVKIQESQLRADSANEMKSRFVADMSHELRTPLNGILGFSDLIARSPDIEKSRNYGRLINTSAKHLHLLVNTMLDLAKIEAGKMDVVRTDCDIREVCDSVAGIHRYTAEAKDLILSVEYSAGIPVFIHTDRIKLMQILNNILHNSIKFTEKGCIFFHIDRSENSWIFKISDTGIGMNSKELARLFYRFSRSSIKAQAVARQVGSGLGMALCKELTELLNGTIHVSSTVDVGTLVEIRICDLNEEEIQNEAPH